MDFRGFIREEEELDLLAEAIIEEGFAGSLLRGVGGFGGNLLGQTARGAGNLALGAGKTAGGLGRVGLGTVQAVTGAGREGLSNIGRGIGDVASGVGTAATGAVQAAGALTGVTPLMRGVQAANEKGSVGPMSKRRTALQQAMGLNSWDPEGDRTKDVKDRFGALKVAYVRAHKAGDANLKRRIRAEMEKVDPKAYGELVRKSQETRRAKANSRWSFLDRSAKPERPEDYLGRLGTEGQAG